MAHRLLQLLEDSALKDESLTRDWSHYTSRLRYPKRKKHPHLSPKLFESPPSDEFSDLVRRLLPVDATYEVDQGSCTKRGYSYHQHVIKVQIGGKEAKCVGEDRSDTDATNAAHAALLLQLHDWGYLRPQKLGIDPNVKLQVYNMAARTLQLPVLKVAQEKDVSSDQASYTVTMTHDILGINVEETGPIRVDAVMQACKEFKQQIELKFKEQGSATLSLRDDNYVNIDNAREILSVYLRDLKDKSGETDKSIDTIENRRQEDNEDDIDKDGEYVDTKVDRRQWHKKTNLVEVDELIDVKKDHKRGQGAVVLIGGKALSPRIYDSNVHNAKRLALLAAAVNMVKRDPTLMPRYRDEQSRRERAEEMPAPVTAVGLSAGVEEQLNWNSEAIKGVPEPSVMPFREEAHHADELDKIAITAELKTMTRRSVKSGRQRQQDLVEEQLELDHIREDGMVDSFHDYPLPVQQDILSMIRQHDLTIITGSGSSNKSVSVPRIIVEDAIRQEQGNDCNIVYVHPLRDMNVSLAHQLSRERNEQLGSVAGYKVAGDSQTAPLGGSVTYCTPGILNARLEIAPEDFLQEISHIIIDEAQSQDVPVSKLFAALKLKRFGREASAGAALPKVILMDTALDPKSPLLELIYPADIKSSEDTGGLASSASRRLSNRYHIPEATGTVEHMITEHTNATVLESTLAGVANKTLARLLGRATQKDGEINPSEAHDKPVEPPTVIDWKSQAELDREMYFGVNAQAAKRVIEISRTTTSGSILVFLTGWSDLRTVQRAIETASIADANLKLESFEILLLHSDNQEDLIEAQESPPPGARRILLATSIAESLKLPDVEHIIDTNSERIPNFTPEGANVSREYIGQSDLPKSSWRDKDKTANHENIINANSEPLIGRPGYAFGHSADLVPFSQLQSLCLRARKYFSGITVRDYFKAWIRPPSAAAVDDAMRELRAIDALDEGDELTEWGNLIAGLGVSPSAMRMILFGFAFRCALPAIVLAASEGIASICSNLDVSQVVREKYGSGSRSDHVAHVNAFAALSDVLEHDGDLAARSYALENDLNYKRFRTIYGLVRSLKARLQIHRVMQYEKQAWQRRNRRAGKENLIKALAFAGRNDHIGVRFVDAGLCRYFIPGNRVAEHRIQSLLRLYLPPGSKSAPRQGMFCTYTEVVNFSRGEGQYFFTDASDLTPTSAIIFAKTVEVDPNQPDTFLLNGWVPIKIIGERAAENAASLLAFRRLWEKFEYAILRGYGVRKRLSADMKGEEFGTLSVMTGLVADLIDADAGMVRYMPPDANRDPFYFLKAPQAEGDLPPVAEAKERRTKTLPRQKEIDYEALYAKEYERLAASGIDGEAEQGAPVRDSFDEVFGEEAIRKSKAKLSDDRLFGLEHEKDHKAGADRKEDPFAADEESEKSIDAATGDADQHDTDSKTTIVQSPAEQESDRRKKLDMLMKEWNEKAKEKAKEKEEKANAKAKTKTKQKGR